MSADAGSGVGSRWQTATPFQQLVAALDNANIYGEDDDVDPLSQRALAFVLEDEARMQQFVKERFKLRGSGKTLSDTTVKNLSWKALQHFETRATAERVPGDLSGVELRRHILTHFEGRLRADRGKIRKHIPDTFHEFVGRADAVDAIASLIAKSSTRPATDRIANPIIASVGSMGSGKTELLRSLPEALTAHDVAKTWMQNAVPIYISFNNTTPRNVDSKLHVEDAAARRILLAHFADRMPLQVCNKLLPRDSLPVHTALECVLEDVKELRGIEHPCVLLCIDELMKCGSRHVESDDDPSLLLSSVGAAMDLLGAERPQGRAVVTVVTSLRRSGLVPETDSFRPIAWIPLSGLGFDDCLRLVSSYVARRGGPTDLATRSWFCGMVAMCSGHPRSLQFLAQELSDACSRGDDVESSPRHRVKVMEQACAAMGNTVRVNRPGLPGIDTLAMLRCIVAGTEVALQDKVGDATVETLIASGLFINAGKQLNSGARGVVPAMSILVMASLIELPHHVQAAVREFMVSACDPRLGAGGSAFEALHVAVEVLKRAVLVPADGKASPPTPLEDLFKYAMKPKKWPQWWDKSTVRFNVPRWCMTQGSRQLHVDFTNVVTARGEETAIEGGDVIVLAAPNNPGCDAVFVDEGGDGKGNIITFMEARYTRLKDGAMATAPAAAVQADLATKFEVLTKYASDTKGELPRNAKFVIQSVLHRRHSADQVQAELDSESAADLAAQWPHGVVRVVHTYDTLCKFYPPTFRHIPDLLTPGVAPVALPAGIKSHSDTLPRAATRSFSTGPSSAPRSHSHALTVQTNPPFSLFRSHWRLVRGGSRSWAMASVVGVALVSGFALSR